MIRIGQGIDVHQLVEGRPLILGGVTIPHTHGLDGHSDADALLHAITDAFLGATGRGDIGTLFPNNDERWRGADSKELLRLAWAPLKKEGWRVANLDCTILAERPKISPHIPAMKQGITALLGIELDACGIKATTTEKLGALGREEGIAAFAVVLLEKQ